MAYCRYCGIQSKYPDKCELCGRQLTDAQAVPTVVPPIVDNTPHARLEKMEEEGRQGRTRLFIGLAVVLIAAAILIFIRFQLYPWVILAATFATGNLLRRYDVIEAYSEDLLMVGLLFLIPAPMFFVLLGLVAYGVIQKDPNYTFIWLMGAYLAVCTILVIVTLLAMPRMVPLILLPSVLGLEKLGFIAAVLGWRSGGTYS